MLRLVELPVIKCLKTPNGELKRVNYIPRKRSQDGVLNLIKQHYRTDSFGRFTSTDHYKWKAFVNGILSCAGLLPGRSVTE